MASETGRRPAENSPQSAADDVRRGAEAMCAGGRGEAGLIESERKALIEWAEDKRLILPLDYVRRFTQVSSGAEHEVFHDADLRLAIKTTYPNRYGHSPFGPGVSSTPVEYLTRLAWQNALFGDEIKVEGVVVGEDYVEIVTTQPWLSLHRERPHPFQQEIDFYFEESSF